MKVKYIVIHHTAGGYSPNAIDLSHYHFLVDGNGKLIQGNHKPEDNSNCNDENYAAHVGGLNTNSIGYAVCAMNGYKSPVSPGKYPIKRVQIEKLCSSIAGFCLQNNIPVTSDIIKTHYTIGKEVKAGIISRNSLTEVNIGKIDITYLPYKVNYKGKYNYELKPDEINDYLITVIKYYYNKLKD